MVIMCNISNKIKIIKILHILHKSEVGIILLSSVK
jgi:hypothetical protein